MSVSGDFGEEAYIRFCPTAASVYGYVILDVFFFLMRSLCPCQFVAHFVCFSLFGFLARLIGSFRRQVDHGCGVPAALASTGIPPGVRSGFAVGRWSVFSRCGP